MSNVFHSTSGECGLNTRRGIAYDFAMTISFRTFICGTMIFFSAFQSALWPLTVRQVFRQRRADPEIQHHETCESLRDLF